MRTCGQFPRDEPPRIVLFLCGLEVHVPANGVVAFAYGGRRVSNLWDVSKPPHNLGHTLLPFVQPIHLFSHDI